MERQARKVGEEPQEVSRWALAESVEEPGIGLRHDEQRSVPERGRAIEEGDGLLMPLIAPIEERHEDPGIEKDQLPQGLSRS